MPAFRSECATMSEDARGLVAHPLHLALLDHDLSFLNLDRAHGSGETGMRGRRDLAHHSVELARRDGGVEDGHRLSNGYFDLDEIAELSLGPCPCFRHRCAAN